MQAKIEPLESGDAKYLFAATGEGVQAIGRINLSLNFSGLLIPFSFLVLTDLQPKILIGTDFLQYSKAKIDFDRNVIELADNLVSVHFDKAFKAEAELFTIASITLPPLAETIEPLIIPQKFVGHTCLIESIPSKSRPDIGIARVIVHPSTQHTMCRVLNASNQPRFLRKHSSIAQIGPANVVATLPPIKPHQGKANIHALLSPPALSVMEAAIDKTGIPIDRSILTDDEYFELCSFLYRNLDVFATSISGIGRTTLAYHHIDTLPNTKPINQRAYRVPLKMRQEIEKQTDELLQAGIIRPSQSPWASPIVMVNKPHEPQNMRLCVDYRKLNAVTQPVSFPMPTIDEILDTFADKTLHWVSSCDIRMAYHQLPVFPKDIPKTAFVTHQAKFEYLSMPFGLLSSSFSYQNLMNVVLKGLTFDTVCCYLDDVAIIGRSPALTDHLADVQTVFDRFKAAGLKLHPKKSFFCRQSIQFLGYQIDRSGLHVIHDKEKNHSRGDATN